MMAQAGLAFTAGFVPDANLSAAVAANSATASAIAGHTTTTARQKPDGQKQEAVRKSL
jgi:hypothetical protein